MLEVAGKDQRDVVDILVLNAATLLVLLVWWVWPLLRWRGQILYDGFIRAYVVLRERSPANPPGGDQARKIKAAPAAIRTKPITWLKVSDSLSQNTEKPLNTVSVITS